MISIVTRIAPSKRAYRTDGRGSTPGEMLAPVLLALTILAPPTGASGPVRPPVLPAGSRLADGFILDLAH
jgi:hypothetical protein